MTCCLSGQRPLLDVCVRLESAAKRDVTLPGLWSTGLLPCVRVVYRSSTDVLISGGVSSQQPSAAVSYVWLDNSIHVGCDCVVVYDGGDSPYSL